MHTPTSQITQQAQDALREIGDMNFGIQMSYRHASPASLASMLTDLETKVLNAKALLEAESTLDIGDPA